MPDTGAPWNIPYVENADLVRDWPADSLLVANAVAAGLSAAGNAGIGSNVVQTVKTDTFSTTSASYVDVTGLSATITPTSATSKVLLIGMVAYSTYGPSSGRGFITWLRTTTNLVVPDSPGLRIPAAQATTYNYVGGEDVLVLGTFVFLDSPATTSATTYKCQIGGTTGGTSFFVNRSYQDANNTVTTRAVSSITLIEVAA